MQTLFFTKPHTEKSSGVRSGGWEHEEVEPPTEPSHSLDNCLFENTATHSGCVVTLCHADNRNSFVLKVVGIFQHVTTDNLFYQMYLLNVP